MKLRILVLVLAVFFIANVSAQVPCAGDLDDIIFKYSAPTNAHAALYNAGAYNQGACYKTIFSESNYPANPHSTTCNAANTIFSLSANTNAHINSIQNTAYNVPVCYADLTCYFDNSAPATCSESSYKVLGRINSLGNAHISNPSDTNYPYKICCKRSSAIFAEWRDSSGQKVNSVRAENETVYATLTSSTGNRRIHIYEDDGFLGKDTVLDIFFSSVTSSNWTYTWSPTINDAKNSERFDYDGFRFRIDNNNAWESEDLEITFCGDDKIQLNWGETCDTGIDQDPIPNPPYGSSIGYCNATTCQIETVSGGYCGDNITQSSNETCDLGTGLNGKLCSPPKCDYCSVDCKNETLLKTDLVWQDLSGQQISYAGRGDTVKLVYLNEKKGDEFKIFDKTKANWLTDIYGKKEKINGTDSFVGTWEIPRNLDLPKWKKLVFNNKKYKKGTEYSNILTITEEGDKPIKITIGGVNCGEVVNKGDKKKLKIEILDPDDLVSGYIKIDGIEVERFTNVVSKLFEPNYKFRIAGTSKIEVYAENIRGEKASAISNVIVYDSNSTTIKKYVAACIKKPSSFQYLKGDYIEFDASNTKAIDDKKVAITIDKLTFDWKFSDRMTNPYTNGANKKSYQFNKSFSSILGYNWADLTVTA